MPAPTDHAVRRREVARAAVHSIARDGLEGATLRSVADEGGWSVGVVQHYFRSKSQLLAAAVDYLAERTSEPLRDVAGAPNALHQLTEVLHAIVPQPGSRSAQNWRVWVCFWAEATNDRLLADAVEEQARRWRERLAETIRAGQADGSVRSDLSADDEAAYLAAVIDGLGVTAAVDNDAPAVTDVVERLVGRLRFDDAGPAAPTPPGARDGRERKATTRNVLRRR